MTAAEVMEEAREQHPAFTIQTTPDSVLLRRLSRYHAELLRAISRINPDELTIFETIDLPMADFAAGEALTPALRRMTPDIRHASSGLYGTLRVVPYSLRHNPKYLPSCTIVEDTLRLLGQEATYTGYDQIRIPYIAYPAEITDGATDLAVPDTARSPIVSLLALFMARRTPAASDGVMWRAPDLAGYAADWDLSEKAFLKEVGQRKSVRTVTKVAVW